MKRVLAVLGTRPEVVKLAPVVRALRERGHTVQICSTKQHDEILTAMLQNRGMPVDYSTDSEFHQGQSLDELTSRMLGFLGYAVPASKADVVLVQGDTTTALCGAMSAFYHVVPVAHVEAGLRTGTPKYPFPEEMNRRLITRLATLHFAPTLRAFQNLRAERAEGLIEMTGNPVVDELLRVLSTISPWRVEDYKHIVLVTCHRREQQTERVHLLRDALWAFAAERRDALVLWSLHPNPRIQEIARHGARPQNVLLVDALDYTKFLSALVRANLVVTDSGGVVEEATTLMRPLLVIRDETERPEANAPLIPLAKMDTLPHEMFVALDRAPLREGIFQRLIRRTIGGQRFDSTFGNGDAGKKIAKAITNWLK